MLSINGKTGASGGKEEKMGAIFVKDEGLFELGKIDLFKTYNSRKLTLLAKEKFAGRQDLVILEVGGHAGINAYDAYKVLKPKLFIVIDCWELLNGGEPYAADNFLMTWHRLHGHDEVIFIKGWSQDVAKILNLEFDFIYIDGDHSYSGVKADILSWRPKMKLDGIFGGHDYNMEGVKQAVNELIPDAKNDGATQGSDWWIFT